jgi:stress response protein SCP2
MAESFGRRRRSADSSQVVLDTQLESTQFKCTFDWYHQGSDADIDVSAVCYDASGQLLDAVFYNELTAFDGAVVHSGDTKGSEGTESINFNLDKCGQSKVKLIVVSAHCYHKDDFRKCLGGISARFVATGKEDPFHKYQCKKNECGKKTGLFLFILYEADGKWFVKETKEPTPARNFQAALMSIKTQMLPKVLSRGQLSDYIASNDKSSFNMKKGGLVLLPPSIKQVNVGLGWDAPSGGSIDLDAGVVLLQDVDHDGDLDPIEYVYFGNKSGGKGSVIGADDNVSGAGDGDDETMQLKLDQIPRNIEALAICVSIYSGVGNFHQIKNAYVRLYAGPDPKGHEYLKFNLSDCTHIEGRSLVFAMLYRSTEPGHKGWDVCALGHGANGRTTSNITTDLWDTSGTNGNGDGDCCTIA